MATSGQSAEKRVLIVGSRSLLAAGLVHLLDTCGRNGPANERVVLREAPEDGQEFARAIGSYRPHLIVVPDFDFHFSFEAVQALHRCTPAPRVVRISPDCNQAFVEDLSQVPLCAIADLLALIPEP